MVGLRRKAGGPESVSVSRRRSQPTVVRARAPATQVRRGIIIFEEIVEPGRHAHAKRSGGLALRRCEEVIGAMMLTGVVRCALCVCVCVCVWRWWGAGNGAKNRVASTARVCMHVFTQ
jgi:hypothetical protein